MKKIGLLGGSFDPLHFGHLNIAIAFLESHHLDSVLFCPAQISPFKIDHPPIVSAQHRLAMVCCGIQKIQQFSVLDWELQERGPSYTIDTVKKLKMESDINLFLLLGEDQLSEVHRWKELETLFSLCKPLVAARETRQPLALGSLSPSLQSLINQGRTKIPMLDISSTIIRQRLSQKKICSHLVPDLVLDYIAQHQLYL